MGEWDTYGEKWDVMSQLLLKSWGFTVNIRVGSSAYIIKAKYLLAMCISSICIINKRGPKRDPAGTPLLISFFVDIIPPI